MQTTGETFTERTVNELTENFFNTIGKEWMLITAGTPKSFNTMTASWGTLGILWHKPVAICFIRTTRHTFGFAEDNAQFTLSFFSPENKEILKYCGAHSGRDVNKCRETGLTPLSTPNNGVTFDKSRLFFDCKKIYSDDVKPENILLPEIEKNIYSQKDYHRLYIGEIKFIGAIID